MSSIASQTNRNARAVTRLLVAALVALLLLPRISAATPCDDLARLVSESAAADAGVQRFMAARQATMQADALKLLTLLTPAELTELFEGVAHLQQTSLNDLAEFFFEAVQAPEKARSGLATLRYIKKTYPGDPGAIPLEVAVGGNKLDWRDPDGNNIETKNTEINTYTEPFPLNPEIERMYQQALVFAPDATARGKNFYFLLREPMNENVTKVFKARFGALADSVGFLFMQ